MPGIQVVVVHSVSDSKIKWSELRTRDSYEGLFHVDAEMTEGVWNITEWGMGDDRWWPIKQTPERMQILESILHLRDVKNG